jgi:hypothetical protein
MESVSLYFLEPRRWIIELTQKHPEVITDRPLEILRSGQFNGKYLWSHRNFNEVGPRSMEISRKLGPNPSS